jgi:RNA polymerase sigma-70 factor (ECF subfamily)
MAAAAPSPELEEAFHAHARLLRGLGYRLTGSRADAEDIVQETFARALARPPARTGEPWKPWLVRVATNLGLDALRRRRRRRYPGPWLPAPFEEDGDPPAAVSRSPSAEARYALLESVSFAFLLALEALSPRQRAVLLLRDAFDYSARETAEALGLSEANVRVVHHRARRAMAAYDRDRCVPTPERVEHTRHALEGFLRALVAGDAAAIEALLADSVRTLTDGGGEVTALHAELEGRTAVARLYRRVAARRAAGARIELGMVNGLPAAFVEYARSERRQAPRMLLRCDVDAAGLITVLHAVLAPSKLEGLRLGAGAQAAPSA